MYAKAILVLVLTIPTVSYGENEQFKKYMDDAQGQSKSDFEGEKGRTAIETCNRIHGIKIPVTNGQDVGRVYGFEKATAWSKCVVNTMYPIK